MWWIVGSGAVLAIAGWLLVVRSEMAGTKHGRNLFTDIKTAINSIHWPSAAKPSASDQEIRNLDQQVFPQFSP